MLQGKALAIADAANKAEYMRGLDSLRGLLQRWTVQSVDGVGPLPAYGAATFFNLGWAASFEWANALKINADAPWSYEEVAASRICRFVQPTGRSRSRFFREGPGRVREG